MLNNGSSINNTIAEHTVNGHPVDNPSSTFHFESKTEEVEDIMSKMPHWIIRQGTTVLLIIIILIFTSSYYIHYPDVLVTNVSITSSHPPIKIVAQTSGKLQQIFVQNNELVEKDQSICLLENPAQYHDILYLKRTLFKLDTTLHLSQVLKTISFNQHVQLGELQSRYIDLYQAIQQYAFFNKKNFVNQKVGQLQSQLNYQSLLNKELESKGLLIKQQLMLEKKRYLTDSSLVIEKVIAPLEFDNRKKELIDRQINSDATKTNILQNNIQRTELLKNITELQQQNLQQENDLEQKIRENVKRLQGQLDLWDQKYLIKSPVAGIAVFSKFWKENQYVTNGEAVLIIVPPMQSYIAKSSLPVVGAGKVNSGQKVLIKLYSFPFQEFGMIRGKVGMVSMVALDSAYSMEIQLTNGLTTTLHKKIPPHPQLTGTAEIVTNDKSILERLFEKVWNVKK